MVCRKAAMGDEGSWQLARNPPILFSEYTMRNHSTNDVASCRNGSEGICKIGS